MCRNTVLSVVIIHAFAVTLMPASSALADSVNSPNISMNVDTNRSVGNGAGNTAVVVNTITIAETNVNEYSSVAGKAISIQVRPGFQFDTASNVTAQSANIGFNGGGIDGVATVTPTGAPDEIITFNLTSGTFGGQDIIRVNGIRLKILSAIGAAGPAQTTMTITTSTAGGAFTNQGIVAATIVKGRADHPAFSIQPGSSIAAAVLLPAVKIVDFGENLITNDLRTISLALNGGAAALLGTTSLSTLNGVATWTPTEGLNITTAGNFTLRASHNGDNFQTSDTVDSTQFEITGGAPNHMVITQQPVDTAAGVSLFVTVVVQDQFNNTTNIATPITLDSAINPGGWPLLSNNGLTKNTVAGVAAWNAADNLRINSAISNYQLSASGVGAPLVTNAFNILANVPALLRFTQQPISVNPNVAMNPPVAVEVIDAFGNRTNSTAAIELSLQSAPCGGTLSGGAAITATDGFATFNAVSLDVVCNANVLAATTAGLPSVASDPFNILGAGCGTCGAGVSLTMAPMLLAQVFWRRRALRR